MLLKFHILMMCEIGLGVQTAPLTVYKHPTKCRRGVPETSYAKPVDYPMLRKPTKKPALPKPPNGISNNAEAKIIRQTQEIAPNGDFSYGFETDNGISVEAKGSQKQLGPSEKGQVMEGRYSYTAPDGTPVEVRWFADETGFHVKNRRLKELV